MEQKREQQEAPERKYQFVALGLIFGAAIGFAMGGPLGAAMGCGLGLIIGAVIDAQHQQRTP